MTGFAYIPGDYYVICDRCGFKRRVSTTRMTWDRLLVCFPECWEPRHPQDFVKAKADKQTVPIARPDQSFSMTALELSNAASKWQEYIIVNTSDSISDEASVGVELNSGAVQWLDIESTAASGGNTQLNLSGYLFESAASGNSVYLSDMTSSEYFIEPGSVTAGSL